VKEPYAHPLVIPRTIILDPKATLTAPLDLFLSSGIKAVDHAAERVTSRLHNPLSDARCLYSLRILVRALRQVFAEPAAIDARLDCQTAMAIGMASPATGAGVGISHAVGHALGGHAGVQHGLTSCVMLPSAMRWNLGFNDARQALVSEAMGRPDAAAGDVIEELIKDLRLPHRLRAMGVAQSDLPSVAAKVIGDHALRGSSRQPKNADEILELLQMAW
jgi:maleylacetate reductase